MDYIPEVHPRPAFLFYETFMEAIELAPERQQNRILRHLVECGLGWRSVESLPYPSNAIVRQMITNIERANERYYLACRNGEKGGHPKLAVDLELAQQLYEELRDWDAVAKRMDISRATLYRARKAAGLI